MVNPPTPPNKVQKRGRRVSQNKELLELMARAVEDGWPIREIMATYSLDYYTIRKFYPDYQPVSRQDLGTLSIAVKATRQALALRGIRFDPTEG